MDWLEPTARFSPFLFATVIVVLLVAGGMRRLSRRTRSFPLYGIDRFLWEYVGNAPSEEEMIGAGTELEERREGEARVLLQRIIEEMNRRGVPARERDAFLQELRGAIRSEQRLHALGIEACEEERRFVETQRWTLAQRFNSIVDDPPAEIVARIKSGFCLDADP